MEELKKIEQSVSEIADEIVGREAKLGNAPSVEVANNTTLRHDLQDVYYQLRIGSIGFREAKEVANVAGKIISSAKAQLDYNVTIGKPDKEIDFFEDV